MNTTTEYLTKLLGLQPAGYRIRVVAEGDRGDRFVFRRSFTIPESPLDCSPYLTNRGIVSEGNKVTVSFSSTGMHDSFTCKLDRGKPVPCKLYYYMEITTLYVSGHMTFSISKCVEKIMQI